MLNGPIFESEAGWGGQLRTWLDERILFIVPSIAVLFFITALVASPQFMTTGASDDGTFTPAPTGIPAGSSATVRRGDSHTTVARRIITDYLTAHSIVLSPGIRVYMETRLVERIRKQSLVVGALIAQPDAAYFAQVYDTWMSDYKKLSAPQKTKWENLARGVKF